VYRLNHPGSTKKSRRMKETKIRRKQTLKAIKEQRNELEEE
jgi:hypothetical protein